MSSGTEGAAITKAVFEGLQGVTKTVGETVQISAIVEEIKVAINKVINIAIVAVVFFLLLFAGIAVASSVTAAAVWRISPPSTTTIPASSFSAAAARGYTR